MCVYIYIDIDECETDHSGGCDHICINTNGSYYCTCQDGYDLMKDNSSCAGMNEIVIIAKTDSIEYYQTLMSVRMIMEGVIKIVTTMLAPTTVRVKMAMN